MNPDAWPRWRPASTSQRIKTLLRKGFCFDLHLIISLPLCVFLFLLIFIEGCFYFLIRLTGRIVEKWSNPFAVRRLIRRARRTEEFATYKRCAERLDELTGRDIWKFSDSNTSDYDSREVRRKISSLRTFRQNNDIGGLVQTLRVCLQSQLVNTLNPLLYSVTFAGTKVLSEELQDEVVKSIDRLTSYLNEHPDLVQKNGELLALIKRLPKDFGSTALTLSGGAMLGLHHLGLVEALLRVQMLPKIICGTSAGSIVAAFVCTRSDQEVLRFMRDPKAMAAFRTPFQPNNWIYRFLHYFRFGYSIDVEAWMKRGEQLFGYMTFLEAYNLTGRILNVSVTRAGAVGESIVLNYQNAPDVLIFSAVIASSSFPWLGTPIHLMEKDSKTGQVVTSVEYCDRYFQDGSLRGDVPVSALRNRWGVNYIVVSQVNPHVFPFLDLRTHGSPGQPVRGWGSHSVWRGSVCLAFLEVALKEHLRFLLRVLALLEVVPTVNGIDMTHLALQEYGGDLNIYPPRFYWQHIFLFNNVPDFLLEWFFHIGRQMVFPKMWILQARFNVEKALRRLSNQVAILVPNGVCSPRSDMVTTAGSE